MVNYIVFRQTISKKQKSPAGQTSPVWGIYPVGDLSCNISGIINRTIAERMTWRRTYQQACFTSAAPSLRHLFNCFQLNSQAFSFRCVKLYNLVSTCFNRSHIRQPASFALILYLSFFVLKAIIQITAVVAVHWQRGPVFHSYFLHHALDRFLYINHKNRLLTEEAIHPCL